jgi:hypothetical protein
MEGTLGQGNYLDFVWDGCLGVAAWLPIDRRQFTVLANSRLGIGFPNCLRLESWRGT